MFNYLDLLGKRFEYGGRGPEAYDCLGLAIECCRRVGKELMDIRGLTHYQEIDGEIKNQLSNFCLIDKPEPFCLVTFKIKPPFVSHIGFVLPSCYEFLHITRDSSVNKARLDDLIWKPRIANFVKLK